MTVSTSATPPTDMIKAFFQKYFIDAFTGMALGLFVTLIAGLIISQIGGWLNLPALVAVGKLASVLMGAGIGVGIAYYLKAP
ncbi:MAG: PTS sugar transporter subunit IIC, partial [Psychrobacter sp.]